MIKPQAFIQRLFSGQSLDEMIDEIRRLRANVLPRGGGPFSTNSPPSWVGLEGCRATGLRFAPGSVAEWLRGGCVQVWLENDVWLFACIYMP